MKAAIAGNSNNMDRGKNLPPKSSKSKPLGFSGDFIALGPKQSRVEPVDVKKPTASTSSGPTKPTPAPLPSLGKLKTKHSLDFLPQIFCFIPTIHLCVLGFS